LTINKLIRECIQKKQSSANKLLQRLVQEDSTRGNEYKAQAIIIEKCRELGLQLDIWDIEEKQIKNHPFYRCDRGNFHENPNVVGILKGSGGGKSLILNGHIDVVPEGDRKDWKVDPYSGKVENGKLYGRGATDMKGGTVALLLAIEVMKELEIPLRGDVLFQSVIEEESGGTGTLATLLRGYTADGAIIPEPTNLKVFPKQQGSMWFRITVKGKAAHGGTRYEGVSSIDKAITIINRLHELEQIRNARITDALFENIPIPVPINVGKIQSGKWPSSVPDIAVIEGRIGVAPNEALKDVEQEMEQWLVDTAKTDSWFKENPVEIEWFGGRWQPGDLTIDHPLMTTLSDCYQEVFGKVPIVEASPWGTDGGILSKAANIPVLIFGPGTTEVAHDANEYIELQKVYEAAEVIALTIYNWCNQEKE
jgi:acetylornithine deacetylase